jgi:hypothetical protein
MVPKRKIQSQNFKNANLFGVFNNSFSFLTQKKKKNKEKK